MTGSYTLFMGICLLNPTLTNVGLGLQKLAINEIPTAETRSRRYVYALVWALGLMMQGLVVALQAKALTIGNASTLGGFAGFGLIALGIFSHVVLKEKISRRELAGMAIIISGTAMLGFFSHSHQRGTVAFEQRQMTIFLLAFCAVAAAMIFFMLRDIQTRGGVVLGLIGGAIGGLGIVFLKIVVGRFAAKSGTPGALLSMLADPYLWLALVGGVGGVVLVQVGYKYGKAIHVVPGFSSMVVITPALCGYLVLNEPITAVCVLSLALITTGVLITTTAARTEKSQAQARV